MQRIRAGHSDFENVFLREAGEVDEIIEGAFLPRQVVTNGSKETPVDLLEIGLASRLGLDRLPPVITHGRGFPPRLIESLPFPRRSLISG